VGPFEHGATRPGAEGRGMAPGYPPAAMRSSADLVITGADVYTMDAARRWSQAIAIRDGRIAAVGTEPEVREAVGPAAEVLHLPGRMVLPGFQDSHVHAPFAGRYRLHVSLHNLPGVDAYRNAVAAYAAEHPQEPAIFGGGWAMEHFAGGTPTKDLLDDLVSDRPVFLVSRDIHAAWANSKAFELTGITSRTPDPPDGRYERDAAGEPTGTMHEGAFIAMQEQAVPAPKQQEWERAILVAQAHLHSLGITGWQDAWTLPETLAAYVALADRGELSAHVVAALWWDRHRGEEQIQELAELREWGTVGNVRATTVKIMTDGIIENFTASMIDPYLEADGRPGENYGFSYLDPEALASAVTRLDALGFQAHMHAIGDRAVRSALDACEAARRVNGRRDSRHHVAHLQVVQAADIPRFRELGVVANCQPYWAQSEPQMDRLTLPFLGQERARLQYPFASLLRSGATLAFGSDWSVTTADPLREMEVAVTRIGPESRANPPFLPDERLSLPDAIAAFTMGSARVQFNDDECGSIEPGKLADLAVIDRNLFRDGPIGDARAEFTIAGGRVVHEAGVGGGGA
jgi:predicted amidohydrolase YtcJ